MLYKNNKTLDVKTIGDVSTVSLYTSTSSEAVERLIANQYLSTPDRSNILFGYMSNPVTLIIKSSPIVTSSLDSISGTILPRKRISISDMRKVRESGEMYESSI